MKQIFLGIVLGIALVFAAFWGLRGNIMAAIDALQAKTTVTVDENALKEKISTCSDLATAKYEISNAFTLTSQSDLMKLFGDHGKKVINVKYAATINFAVDLSKATVDVDHETNTINVKMPCATMHSINVPAKGVEIVEQRGSLINSVTAADMKVVIEEIEGDATATCDMDKMIKMANTQAVKCMSSLLCPITKQEDGAKTYKVNVSIDGPTDFDAAENVALPEAK